MFFVKPFIKGFSKHIYQVFSDREYGLIAALAELSSDDILIIFGKRVIHWYNDEKMEQAHWEDIE